MGTVTSETPTDLMLATEAARAYGVAYSTVQKWMADGKVRRFRKGQYRVYVSRADMERMTRIAPDEGSR